MATDLRLSLFGPPDAPFLVPAKSVTAVARRGGQGRPAGRRAWRASLDGPEHGRRVSRYGTSLWRVRPNLQAFAVLGVFLLSEMVVPTLAFGRETGVSPTTVSRIVDEAAERFALPPSWIHAVIVAESRGDSRAVSPKGAMGLMQLMPGTWRELSAQYRLGMDPFDRRANVMAGAAYMRQLLDRFGRDGFLAAYNAGPGRYAQVRAGRRRLPAETALYVAQVERSIAAGGGSAEMTRTPSRVEWRASSLFAHSLGQDASQQSLELFVGVSHGATP